MRKLVTLLAGLVLALAVFLPGSALSAEGGTNLPYKGSFIGTAEVNLLTGRLHIGTAVLGTHFGSAYLVQDGYAIPFGSGSFHIFTSFVLTAANGDTQLGTCTGTATTTASGDHIGTSDCLITGGTGRFEDSTGHFTATSVTTNFTVVGATMSGDLQGTVDGVMSWR
jgi:hypothetical protein